MNKKFIFTYALLRVFMGWLLLWAFLDKTFGLGFSTASQNSWLFGASPTAKFLEFGTKGPFADFFLNLAGNSMVDFLFMFGLLCMGTSLILGIFLRLSGLFGFIFMMVLYAAGSIWPTQNPFLDQHIIYALVLLSFSFLPLGYPLGFGDIWSDSAIVRKFKLLK